MEKQIVVKYSDDGLFGNGSTDEIDVAKSHVNFEDSLRNLLTEEFPGADIVIEYGINDSHSVDGYTDTDEAADLGEAIERVWSSYNWTVIKADQSDF